MCPKSERTASLRTVSYVRRTGSMELGSQTITMQCVLYCTYEVR